MIRVMIVDDHAIVRRGLELLLGSEPGIDVVGSAEDGAAALAIAEAVAVDVALMDLSMPGIDGVEATRLLRNEHPQMKVVVLTTFSDEQRVLDALDSGAIGYLLKDAVPDQIMSAIRAAACGDSPLDPRAARILLEFNRSGRPARHLSSRELEVLALVCRGFPNKQIARRLGITERTVKAHLTSVFQQLGVTDRTQAALWARDHGLVQDQVLRPSSG